jgi:hypothetical protein
MGSEMPPDLQGANGTNGPVSRSFKYPWIPASARAYHEQLLAGLRNMLRDNHFVPAAVNVS